MKHTSKAIAVLTIIFAGLITVRNSRLCSAATERTYRILPNETMRDL